MNLSLVQVQCECHIGKQTVIAGIKPSKNQVIRIKLLILGFPEVFAPYSQFPGWGKCPFPPLGRPWISSYHSCYIATMVLPSPHDILHSSPMYNQVFLVFCKRELGS